MFKLKFFGRKKDEIYPGETKSTCINLSGRNYDELSVCDTTLKIWLSESVEIKLNEMCCFVDTTMSDIIRQVLFIHLYGRYDLFGLIERQDKTFNLNQGIRCKLPDVSPTNDEISKMRENYVADIKLWIPKRMKDDLQLLADRANKKVSSYAREVILAHLFGNIPTSSATHSDPPINWSDTINPNDTEIYK